MKITEGILTKHLRGMGQKTTAPLTFALGRKEEKMNSQASIKYFRLVLAGLLLAVTLTYTQALATVVDLSFVAANTAVDNGPQDGVFDAFVPLNFGSVNNNGWTSFRTAFEFDISAIPAGSTINAATLTMFVNWVEGTRQIALHGYTGDGAVQLTDFSCNGLVDSTVLSSPSSQYVVFDVTDFIDSLISSGETFAGFNVREEPANTSNFTVLFFNMDETVPRLSVDFTPSAVAVGGSVTSISPRWGTVICQNWTTRKTVKINIPDGVRSWDCEQAGLVVNQGDKITMWILVTGRAD